MTTQVQTPPTPRASKFAQMTALVGLYGLCTSIVLSTSGVNVSLALIVIATVIAWRPFWSDCRDLSLFWWMVAATAYVAIHSLIFVYLYPELDDSSNPHWSHVARITGLVSLAIAWWITENPRHLRWLLLTACLGLLTGLLSNIDYAALARAGIGARYAWGTPSGQVGYLAALGFIGCFVIGMRRLLTSRRPSRWWLAGALWLTAAVFLLVLYGSQTRAAWMAATTALIGYVCWELAHALRRPHRTFPLLLGTVALIAISSGLLHVSDVGWERRTGNALHIVNAISERDRDALIGADRSTANRVDMWIVGYNAVLQAPITGWGLGAKPRVAEQAELTISPTGHFHNLYLELAVGLGLPGLILFALVYALIGRSFFKQIGETRGILHSACVAGGLLLIMSLIVVLFDVRIGGTPGRTAWMLLLALVIVPSLSPRRLQTINHLQKSADAESSRLPLDPMESSMLPRRMTR